MSNDMIQNAADARPLYAEILSVITRMQVARGALLLVSVPLGIVVTRLLGPEEFGKLTFVWTLVATFGAVGSLGLSEVLARFVPSLGGEGERRNLYHTALIAVLGAWIVGMICYCAITRFGGLAVSELNGIEGSFLVGIGVAALLTVNLGMLRGMGRFMALPLVDLIKDVLSRALIIGIAMYFAVTSYQAAFFVNTWFLCGTFVVSCALLGATWFRVQPVRLAISRLQLWYAFLTCAGSLLVLGTLNVHNILLKVFMSVEEVGYLAAGMAIPRMLLAVIVSSIAAPLIYYFSGPIPDTHKRTIIEIGTKTIEFFTGAITLIVLALAEWLILTLLGPGYSASVPVLQAFTGIVFVFANQTFLGPHFYGIHRPLVPLLFGTGGFVLMFALDLVLIPTFGSVGAALAEVFAAVVQSLVYVEVMQHVYRIGIQRASLTLIALWAAAAAFELTVGMFSGVLVFVVAAIGLGVIRPRDLQYFMEVSLRREPAVV